MACQVYELGTRMTVAAFSEACGVAAVVLFLLKAGLERKMIDDVHSSTFMSDLKSAPQGAVFQDCVHIF
jgi:hypothetical protein